eukprot:31292-Pelagococcus_subviridis.AAC.9
MGEKRLYRTHLEVFEVLHGALQNAQRLIDRRGHGYSVEVLAHRLPQDGPERERLVQRRGRGESRSRDERRHRRVVVVDVVVVRGVVVGRGVVVVVAAAVVVVVVAAAADENQTRGGVRAPSRRRRRDALDELVPSLAVRRGPLADDVIVLVHDLDRGDVFRGFALVPRAAAAAAKAQARRRGDERRDASVVRAGVAL